MDFGGDFETLFFLFFYKISLQKTTPFSAGSKCIPGGQESSYY